MLHVREKCSGVLWYSYFLQQSQLSLTARKPDHEPVPEHELEIELETEPQSAPDHHSKPFSGKNCAGKREATADRLPHH